MRIYEILRENKSADLYHGTSVENAEEILEQNQLNVGENGFVSFSRSFSKSCEFAGNFEIGVIFVLDQLRISQMIGKKIKPYAADDGCDDDESEEASSVDIPNFNRYIKQIIVLNFAEIEYNIEDFPLVFNDRRTIIKSGPGNYGITARQFQHQHRLRENVSVDSSIKIIVDILTTELPNIYRTLSRLAENYFDSHGELGKGYRFISGGAKSKWYHDIFFKQLKPALYKLLENLPRNSKIELKEFLSSMTEEGSFNRI